MHENKPTKISNLFVGYFGVGYLHYSNVSLPIDRPRYWFEILRVSFEVKHV